MIILCRLVPLLFVYNVETASTIASIVNGRNKPIEPNLGEFPFQASLMIHQNGAYRSFCGGSLIHPQWILTAAHCLELDGQSLPAKTVFSALGSILYNAKGAQLIPSERLVINANYLKTGKQDVGLIKLKTPAKLGRNVKLIKLHTDNKESLLGKKAFLTGFGIINDFYDTPTRLRKALLHIATPDKCQMSANSGEREICASSTIEEGKACKGDSGGPLTIPKNGRYIQVGITSHLAILPFCKISFNNSVYTRVSAYIAWISKITGIDFMKYNPGSVLMPEKYNQESESSCSCPDRNWDLSMSDEDTYIFRYNLLSIV